MESTGRTLKSEAQLKLNHDKKVRFAEQLQFKLDEIPLFENEKPMQIEFKNN